MCSLSNESIVCELKKYIDQIGTHKEYRVLTWPTVVRGSNSFLIFSVHIMVVYSLWFYIDCILQIAKFRADSKIVIFDNINTFKLKKDLKVKT